MPSLWDKFQANKPSKEVLDSMNTKMTEQAFRFADLIQGIINDKCSTYDQTAIFEGLLILTALHEEALDFKGRRIGVPDEDRVKAVLGAKLRAKQIAIKMNQEAIKEIEAETKEKLK